ncbi:hypothetical protein Ahy_A09g041881 isoform A [Arachis hypogaea]|uniref:RING-type domain-containing protein n=1 Tax=Arachis hypogaea TaxID=3818 RepID=A0A445BE22_ARAHY|nr:hypothetical protein Ahy_A09g041881 isoform A [Arachis hypogaea]
MENDTAATNTNGSATATAKLAIAGGKSNSHSEEEDRSNFNNGVEEHMAEQVDEEEEEEAEAEEDGDGGEGGEGEQTGSASRQPSRTPFTNLSQVDADLALARTLQEQARLGKQRIMDAWEDVDPDELSYEELLALGEVVGTESRGLSTDTLAGLPSIKFKTGSDQHGSNDSCVICRMDYEDDESLTVLSCKHLYHPECINNWLKINKVCPVCSTEVSASGSS